MRVCQLVQIIFLCMCFHTDISKRAGGYVNVVTMDMSSPNHCGELTTKGLPQSNKQLKGNDIKYVMTAINQTLSSWDSRSLPMPHLSVTW